MLDHELGAAHCRGDRGVSADELKRLMPGTRLIEQGSEEDVVQDSFIAMHITRPRLEDGATVLPYLRQCVVNRSRSVLRHRVVVDRHPLAPVPDMPSAEESALTRLGHSATISGLNLLAPRQRQVQALRFFADMSEAQIAAALGISKGTVKTHTSRGLTSLRPALEPRA